MDGRDGAANVVPGAPSVLSPRPGGPSDTPASILGRLSADVRAAESSQGVASALRTRVWAAALTAPGEIHVYLADGTGTLRLAGEHASSGARPGRWTAVRRGAFTLRETSVVDLSAGAVRAILPIATENAAFGTLEVSGPRAAVDRSLPLLELMAAVAAGGLEVLLDPGRAADGLDLGLGWTAHEIAGPLDAIRAALECVLQTGDVSGSRALLEMAADEAASLSEDVRHILGWASGREPLRLRRTDLARLIRRVVTSATGPTDARGPVVRVEAPRQLMATVDELHVQSAVSNLVRNAVNHARTSVEVSVRRRGDHATICVRDDGPGVPDDERSAIFDRFVRGASAPQVSGTGLGLFIARRVVEAHRGSLELAQSSAGATFVIDLPLEGAAR